MTANKPVTQYFFSLDAIRGFACLVVIICHWQFFFYKNYTYQDMPLEAMGLPLFSLLSPIYHHAFFAVDLFFLLSGFIFFWFYSQKIANRKTPFNDFIFYRFTRLYPVHFITLISLVFIQTMMINVSGHPYIIQNNDSWHFFLNMLLVHSWGFEKTPALNGFNGPSWSASVEVLLYLLFFILSFSRLHNNKKVVIGLVVAGAAVQKFYPMIGQGMYSFFLGGLVYHMYTWLSQRKNLRKTAILLCITAAFLWIMILSEFWLSYIRTIYLFLIHKIIPQLSEEKYLTIFNLAVNTFFRTAVSPVTVLALAMMENIKGGMKARWITVLGNSSYAIYMIHFPLMVMFAVVVETFGISRSVFQSPFTLLSFYSILIPISIATHYYFELPVQQTLRAWLVKKPKVVPVIAEKSAIT